MNITAMGQLNRLLTYISLIKTLNIARVIEQRKDKNFDCLVYEN